MGWTGISLYLCREDHVRAGHERRGDTELRPSRTCWTGRSSRSSRPRRAYGSGRTEGKLGEFAVGLVMIGARIFHPRQECLLPDGRYQPSADTSAPRVSLDGLAHCF
jgi:hypothetical protein